MTQPGGQHAADPLGPQTLARLCSLLGPSGPVDAVTAAAMLPKDQITEVARVIGAGPVGWALEEAAESLVAVGETFAAEPDLPWREIGLSLETMLLDLLTTVISPADAGISVRYVSPIARGAARRDIPFRDVIRSMRGIQARWVAELFAQAVPAQASAAVAESLVAAASSVFDEEISRFVEFYLAEREALVESEVTRRRLAVEALLRGDVLDGPRPELGLDLDWFHLGLVVTRSPGSASIDTRRLTRVLAEAAPRAGLLLLPTGTNRVWGWVSTCKAPTPDMLRRLGDALAPLPGLRCSLGAVEAGPAGFRQTHLQAVDMAALAPLMPGAGLLCWRDHALVALLTLDAERARWFVQRTLGPLAEPTEAAQEHRRTLQAYLESGHSLLRAAERRQVHRNTIVYRLRRVEQLIGRPVGDDDLELRCALHLADRLGVALLGADAPTVGPAVRAAQETSNPGTSDEAHYG